VPVETTAPEPADAPHEETDAPAVAPVSAEQLADFIAGLAASPPASRYRPDDQTLLLRLASHVAIAEQVTTTAGFEAEVEQSNELRNDSPSPIVIHYGTTKTAQVALARGLAESVAGTGVTVNSVLPGPTASEGVTRFVADMGRARAVGDRRARVFSDRPAVVAHQEVRDARRGGRDGHVCSELASAMTGAALRVDGGVVRAIV
jgi:NAD(P)-dependent dehydrogenase (short-subunit alcohol dehydrogenase family)